MAINDKKNMFVNSTNDDLLPQSFGVEENWANMHGVEPTFSGRERHRMYCLNGKVDGNTSAEKSVNIASGVYDEILGRMLLGLPAPASKMAFQYLVQNLGYSVKMESSDKIPFVMYVSDEPGYDQAFTIVCGNRNVWATKTRDEDNNNNARFHMAMYFNRADGAKNEIENVDKHFDYYGKTAGLYQSKLDVVPTADGGCIIETSCRAAQGETLEKCSQEDENSGMTLSTFTSIVKVDEQGNVVSYPSDDFIASVFVPVENGEYKTPNNAKLDAVEERAEERIKEMTAEANRLHYYTSIEELDEALSQEE